MAILLIRQILLVCLQIKIKIIFVYFVCLLKPYHTSSELSVQKRKCSDLRRYSPLLLLKTAAISTSIDVAGIQLSTSKVIFKDDHVSDQLLTVLIWWIRMLKQGPWPVPMSVFSSTVRSVLLGIRLISAPCTCHHTVQTLLMRTQATLALFLALFGTDKNGSTMMISGGTRVCSVYKFHFIIPYRNLT